MPPAPPRLARYLRPYTTLVGAGTVCLLITNLFALGIPWALERAIDSLRLPGGARQAQIFALYIVGLAVGQAVIRVLSRIFLFNTGRNIEFDVRRELLGKLLGLSPSFFRTHPTGNLMSRLTNDLTALRVMFGFGTLNIVNTVFIYSMVMFRLFSINATLTLLALLPYPLLIFAGRAFGRAIFRQNQSVLENLGRMTSLAQEDFSGIAMIKHYGLEDLRGRAFERLSLEFLARSMNIVRTRGLMFPLMGMLGAGSTLIVLWAGGRAVIDGRLTLGQFAAFHMYILQLAWPTLALGFILSVWQRGMASWERLRAILTAEVTLGGGSATLDQTRGELEVRGLSLTHGERKALDGIDLKIPAGTTLAIVGRTGSGKSTLAEAVSRMTEVPRGTVFLDGIDVCDLTLDAVRSAVGYAPQEAFLFSATLRENIEMGRRGSSETIERLCQVAGLTRDLAGFPAGLETLVGERGITLSGGQRQRVALARALATDPRVVILDDSLSSVDAETERDILRGLGEMLPGRTAIIISHRVAAIQHADEIAVLEAGRIVERGRHSDLIRRGGVYSELYQRQLLEQQLEGAA